MVGSALLRRLRQVGCQLLTVERRDVDLRRQQVVERWMSAERPHAVFLAAAQVGGIGANNSAPVDFLYDNLAIATNVIHAAAQTGVEKLLFLGSSCIYPKFSPQPITEETLLTGPLEPTNQWYAIAKIAGLKLCQAYRRQHGCDYIAAMPTNLYGPGDNFDANTSHVIPALLRKAHEAKLRGAPEFVIWGSGTPRRDFLHVDDAADALVHLMIHYSDDEPVNVGSGGDLSIHELASLIGEVVGFRGNIVLDSSRPDGTPRKLLDTSKLTSLGWRPRIALREGLVSTYQWFATHSAGEDAKVHAGVRPSRIASAVDRGIEGRIACRKGLR
jgi:GDP-L-fucose synthase